jgi:hypothetical protein
MSADLESVVIAGHHLFLPELLLTVKELAAVIIHEKGINFELGLGLLKRVLVIMSSKTGVLVVAAKSRVKLLYIKGRG